MAAAFGSISPEEHFLSEVKPLLDSRCVSCHGSDKIKGGLRLDSREALIKGGDSGPAMVPGNPQASLLLQAVLHAKKDLEMPPKERLAAREVALLEKWIAGGAPWPVVSVRGPAPAGSSGRLGDAWSDPRNPIRRIFGGQRLDLWSLKPVQRPSLPQVRHYRAVRNPIDAFVLARLEERRLEPASEADRRVLARRLFFDLTGLPPTPEEMNEFLKDQRTGAYERLVDRLLESTAYGEHAARHWLDVVRYSDSNGFDWDEFRRQAWRYRDYVIRSFNEDKPFNDFIIEQLAGDELLDGPPTSERDRDRLIATGYLRLGPHDNSAAAFNEQARSRAELMVDLVETTSSSFLGLTMACCRCHDHKFDPLSQADHFRMRAFFEGVKFADDVPLDLAPDQARIRGQHEEIEKQIKPLKQQRDRLLADVKRELEAKRVSELTAADRDLLRSDRTELSPEQQTRADALRQRITPSEKEIQAALSPDQKKTESDLSAEIARLTRTKTAFTFGLLMTDAESAPAQTRILFQGDYKSERDAVEPGFISALDPNPARISKGANAKTLGRRLTLARWIASEKNPLTARVIVNRIWQSHFGVGLVATPNDFGLAGAPPTHPELLDWLASEFMTQGWSVKKLHRLIVTSATYRQASSPAAARRDSLIRVRGRENRERDFDNRWLARQNLRRLTAEQLRDALLAVSGKLVPSDGGPPVWPELPAEILVANPAFLDDNAEKTKGWYASPREQQDVRSLFLVQKRTVKIPFLETFDLPENATSCPRRNESVVAPQALTLFNGPLGLECARRFAARLKGDATPDREAVVREAFALAFQRSPDPEELAACVALVTERGLPALCRSLLNANEFIYID